MSDAEDQARDKTGGSLNDFCRTRAFEAEIELFNSFDKNHDNKVSKAEVFLFLNSLQLNPENQARLEAAYKATNEGTLDFEEFQVFLEATR
jgi:Ca2+-binding EF-hand superfamily protein